MKSIEDPRWTYNLDKKSETTPFERLLPAVPYWLQGQYMAKLVEQEVNILDVTSTYIDKIGDDDRHFVEYYVAFEYSVTDKKFTNGKRWAKMAVPVHVSYVDDNYDLPLPFEQIYGAVLCIVESARGQLED